MRFGIGQAVRRKEDQRLLTGTGRYVDDVAVPNQAHAVLVRSPHAFARIRSIDAAKARAMPGVLAVLTGADALADGLGPLPCDGAIVTRDGGRPVEPPRCVLAAETARHVGDPVALVVAETSAQALDAAEAVGVDYEILPAVTRAIDAVAPAAPQVWPEAPGNLAFEWEAGDRAAVERAFAGAAHVARVVLDNNRLVANPLEPRGALGVYDPGQDRYTLCTSTQGSHLIRRLIAAGVLGVDETRLRVVTPDVGGGFGMKMYLYPEQPLVLWASRRAGRPVKWIGQRGEGFVSDAQGRDQRSVAELALDRQGRFLALRVSTHANLGAYLSTLAPLIPTTGGTRPLTGPYDIPAAYVEVRGVFTNTVPVDAYRGAGRPESVYLIERLVERAAQDLRVDPVALRRQNLVPPSAMPYRTAFGQLIDSGEFERNLDDALALADWAGFAERRAEAAARGRLRGIGVATYVEPCGGNRDQLAELRFHPTGAVTVLIGTQSNGQGHETAYAQIVSDQLGVPFDRIRVVQGDTDQVAYGRGTSGSRSMPIGGAALFKAGERVLAKARRIAAHALEVAESDLEFQDGAFRVAGTDRRLTMAEIVRIAFSPGALPDGLDMGLDEIAHHMARPTTYPNGCHVCEVEIDPDTGRAAVVRYTAVDDFGRVINPMLVEGQVHGALAQGIGQALFEDCVYDESGQLLSGSFMDYAMPRAEDLPSFASATNEVPCRTNPLGVKGCGEAGAIAAPPTVINAVLDALAAFGVSDIAMPATPMRIWRAIQEHRTQEKAGAS